ncbi:MAG TPA: ABC transporter permease [Epsilonproteobacteria bacterium]|nr:ABC transporter permease [Campylobacterota bacterium]
MLAFSFAKRDFNERYVGTGLGQFWYILSPLVMIFIYTVIFSDFMKMKLEIVDNSYAYSIYLVPGLLAWTTFSTIIMRLNGSFFEKSGLIKKINVPMYTFQLSIVLTEGFLFFISMTLALGFLIIVDHVITWVFLWMIPVMFLQILFAFGLGVIVSLFTPFFRDLREVVPIVMQLWFWMTPIIYMASMIEERYPFLLKYNPFYLFVSIYQDIFLYSKPPNIEKVMLMFIMTSTSLIVAGYLYKKMISVIKDII